MKKVISLLMVLALACLLCVPAFAAGTAYTQDQLKTLVSTKVPAEYQAAANEVVAKLTGGATVNDPAAVKAAATSLQNTLTSTKDAAAVEAAIKSAASVVSAQVTEISIDPAAVSVNVDIYTGKVTVSVPVVVGDQTVTPTVETKAAQIYWTDSSKKTSATVAATTAGVIKATGFDSTSLVLVVLAVAGILSVATVKARKLG